MIKRIGFACFALFLAHSWAQSTPFNCDYNAYLFQYNDVYAIDLASGSYYTAATDVTTGNINAAAFNPADGYIWGSLSEPAKTIVRIGKDFSTDTFTFDELPTSNRYVGGINSNGVYYLKGGGTTYYKLDLNPGSASYLQHLATENLSASINIHDWAFNAVDGQLYSVEKQSNKLYRINPQNGQVLNLGVVPILSGLNYTFGAVYFDASGRFYVSSNQTGTIYVIQNVQDLDVGSSIDSNLFAFGPSSSSNDGARCPTAPVPQENCTNGVDDDGDGLVDCDDPSCSGVSSCPVMEAPTSSASAGGLESNNRLSTLISQRNYKRLQTNSYFDKSRATRVIRDATYKQRLKNNSYGLRNFIPLEELGEDYVVESSPNDLLGITNAVDVYSVDYIENDQTVASILALKTENGVYEHTKYICDRLLGAELIAVSTIDIKGHSFIRSIIKNADGSQEFVLSLAATESKSKSSFEIESHWNLDEYTQEGSFYNFQIWSNSIDDLFILAEQLVELIEVQKPISKYKLSAPPKVFVRKGSYSNGMLSLEIANANNSSSVALDGGLRPTETAAFQDIQSEIQLDGYLTKVALQTGRLFDVGFRIGTKQSTPDDVFLSDGPWGVDFDKNGTEVTAFNVVQDQQSYDDTVYPIERAVQLEAQTATYISLYRALTPRFKAVNLSDYNTLEFEASGTAKVSVSIIKSSMSNWEDHFTKELTLTSNKKKYSIPINEFRSKNHDVIGLDDVVSIIFTMTNENGEKTKKKLNVEKVAFAKREVLDIETIDGDSGQDLRFVPNPMSDQVSIQFSAVQSGEVSLQLFNAIGTLVYRKDLKVTVGTNQTTLRRGRLPAGIYFCKIEDKSSKVKTSKLIIR